MNQQTNSISTTPKPWLILCLLWLVGWTLRVPILAAPPLALQIGEAFGLNEAGTGALTMLPIMAVAFGAIPAAWFIARFGLRWVIVTGLLIMALASVARGLVPSVNLLFAASVVMGLGVALYQTALPSATRNWTPTHIALGSAVYLNGMMVGELSGAGLTLPLVLPMAGGDWRMALNLWSMPIVAIAVWVALVKLPAVCTEDDTNDTGPKRSLPQWNDIRVWQYGLLLASSVVSFFVVNAYAGLFMSARGESQALDGLLFGYNAMPMLASFIVLWAPQWVGYRKPIAVTAILTLIGLAGFVLLSGWASWACAMLLGCAATVEVILILGLLRRLV